MRKAVALLLLCCAGSASAALPGDLPFTRHAPTIEVFPQNFALAQDLEGVVYVGNTEGLLTFDGSRWDRVAMPRKDLIRSLKHDGRGRVYVGGYDTFGYVERDATGRETYHDLTPIYAGQLGGESFADIWDIHVAPNGVFFRALRHVFLYQPVTQETKLWRHAGRFGAIGDVDGALLLQFRGEGLRRYEKGEWVVVPGSTALSELVYELAPLPGGGALTLAPDGQWRAWRNGRIETVAMPAGFPTSDHLTTALRLDDGTLAMPSDDGSLYLLDLKGGRYRRTQLDPGYLNDVVPAASGGLLVAGDEALYHVEWPASWTLVGSGHGISGSSHHAERWGERWYVLGGSGVLRQAQAPDGALRFEATGWPVTETWDLLPIDADRALVADSYAVQLVDHDRVAPVTHNAIYPRVLLRSRFDPDVIFVGGEPGVAVLRQADGAWQLAAERNDLQNLRVLSLVETAPHTLWVGSERAGVWRVLLDDEDRTIRDARAFASADGIEYGELPTATLYAQADGTLLALTARGAYRWTGERFEASDVDGLLAAREGDETLTLRDDPSGARWAWSYNHVYRQAKGEPWHREDVSRIGRGALESLAFDEDGAPVFCSSYALLRYDRAAADVVRPSPRLLLRSVERLHGDGRVERLAPGGGAVALPDERVALSLRFALADLRRPDLVRYAVRLQGLEDRWSEWTADPAVVYKRLPPGNYVFELRGRDSQGVETTTAPLSLRILPQWYDTLWARALAVLLALGALAALTLAVVRWRTARLAADRARLQLVVAERTAELELANRRLESMANLDGLTGIANRRRLDDCLEQAWTQCAAAGQRLSLLAIDLDRFKAYNDRHGHLAGDELLRELVRTLAVCVGARERELLARFGGDEFMVVLPGVELREAHRLAERMRQEVESAIPGCTVSIGVGMRDPRLGGWIAELIGAADAALYQAKAAGRNRVVSEAAPPATATT